MIEFWCRIESDVINKIVTIIRIVSGVNGRNCPAVSALKHERKVHAVGRGLEETGVLVERVIPPALLVGAAVVAIILFVVFLFEYFLFVILFVGHNC